MEKKKQISIFKTVYLIDNYFILFLGIFSPS